MCGSLLVFGLQQGMTGASPEPGSDVPALTRAATRVTPNHVTPNTSTGAAAASSAGAGVSFGPNADGKRPRRKKKRPQDTIEELDERLRACRLQLQQELDVNIRHRVRLLLMETHASCERLLLQLLTPEHKRAPAGGGGPQGSSAQGAGPASAGAPATDEALCQQLASKLEHLTRFVKDRYGRTRRTRPLGPFVSVKALLQRLIAARDARVASARGAHAGADPTPYGAQRRPEAAELLGMYRLHVWTAAAALERLDSTQGSLGTCPELSKAVLEAYAWLAEAVLLRPDMHMVLATCTADGEARGPAPGGVWDGVVDRLLPLPAQQDVALAAASDVMRLAAESKDRHRQQLAAKMAARPWDVLLQSECADQLEGWLHTYQLTSCAWVLLFAALLDEHQLAVIMMGAAPWLPQAMPLFDALAARREAGDGGEPSGSSAPSDSGAAGGGGTPRSSGGGGGGNPFY